MSEAFSAHIMRTIWSYLILKFISQSLWLLVKIIIIIIIIIKNSATNLHKASTIWNVIAQDGYLRLSLHITKVISFGVNPTANCLTLPFEAHGYDTADCFKYLGIMFNFNGNFLPCKKELTDQELRAMYSVLSEVQAPNLPTDISLDLFDRMVVPVLSYASEV